MHAKIPPPLSFNIKKLKDFKINGTIGGSSEKDRLTYFSLSFQLKNGLRMRCSNMEIRTVVIRDISPCNTLRSYLVSHPELKILLLIGY